MSDLTAKEQANVKRALSALRLRFGTIGTLAKALRFSLPTLRVVPSVTMAFRVARLAGVPVDDVLSGRFPAEGACPYCGHAGK